MSAVLEQKPFRLLHFPQKPVERRIRIDPSLIRQTESAIYIHTNKRVQKPQRSSSFAEKTATERVLPKKFTPQERRVESLKALTEALRKGNLIKKDVVDQYILPQVLLAEGGKIIPIDLLRPMHLLRGDLLRALSATLERDMSLAKADLSLGEWHRVLDRSQKLYNPPQKSEHRPFPAKVFADRRLREK